MQAVILAAGKSTRTYPLTIKTPKCLLPIANKSLILRQLEILSELVNSVVIVVGYEKERVLNEIKNFNKISIQIVEQSEIDGTGSALIKAKNVLEEHFIVINGDDLYSKKDLERCLNHKYCVMARRVHNPECYGVFEVNENKVLSLEEKPLDPKSDLVNIGVYVFNKEVLEHRIFKSARNEYEITDFVKFLIKSGDNLYFEEVKNYWVPITFPWDLLKANQTFIEKNFSENNIQGTIEKNVKINGIIGLGENSIIKSGTTIKGNLIVGKNCIIGPNSIIEGSVIVGNDCRIETQTEIKNSLIMNGSLISPSCKILGSIIGKNVKIGIETILEEKNEDNSNIKFKIRGKTIDSKKKELGSILANNVTIEARTKILPGKKVWPNLIVKDEIVKNDIESN